MLNRSEDAVPAKVVRDGAYREVPKRDVFHLQPRLVEASDAVVRCRRHTEGGRGLAPVGPARERRFKRMATSIFVGGVPIACWPAQTIAATI